MAQLLVVGGRKGGGGPGLDLGSGGTTASTTLWQDLWVLTMEGFSKGSAAQWRPLIPGQGKESRFFGGGGGVNRLK